MTLSDTPPARPLLVTADEPLLDNLLRLTAAAGVTPDVAQDTVGARRLWSAASLVVVGTDVVSDLAAAGPPRRSGVLVVCPDDEDAELWRDALRIGAEQVTVLPRDEQRLADRFAETIDARERAATTLAVVGGCGGAGASTFAAGLGVAASRAGGEVLIIDADPFGGGLELVLGCEDVAGSRWPELMDTSGRVSAPSLRHALPDLGALRVLSWDRGQLGSSIPPDVMREVVAAGERGHDLVVVDLARRVDDAAEEALLRAQAAYLVVPAEVRAVAAAGRMAARLRSVATTVELVVRGPGPTGIDGSHVADALQLPLAVEMKPERGMAASLDMGRGPWRRDRGPLAKACRTVLERHGSRRVSAA